MTEIQTINSLRLLLVNVGKEEGAADSDGAKKRLLDGTIEGVVDGSADGCNDGVSVGVEVGI